MIWTILAWVLVIVIVVAYTTAVIRPLVQRYRQNRKGRYMMATVAIHQTGDISRATPSLCLIHRQDRRNFYGNWVEGLGFVDVRFPKHTTRPLTEEERAEYRGKWWGINGCPLHQLDV